MNNVLEAENSDKKGLIGKIDKSKIAVDAEHCSCHCACDCICICDCDYSNPDIWASENIYGSEKTEKLYNI